MSSSRDAADLLMRSVVQKIRAEFNHTRVPGLSSIPTTIKVRPKPHITPFPYVYVYISNSTEVDKTKQDASRRYVVQVQVVTKSNLNATGEQTRDGITSEIVRILDTQTSGYLDLSSSGYNVYVQDVSDVVKTVNDATRTGTYYLANISLMVTMDFVGTSSTNTPVQESSFSYSGFTYTPVGDNIEFWDAGTIVPATSYSSDNNGWDFVSTTFTLASGAQGTISGGNYVVDRDDNPLGLNVNINYRFHTDNTETDTLTETTTYTRIRSLRYGSFASASRPTFTNDNDSTTGLQNIAQWNGTRRTLDFNNVNPVGDQITIQTNAGEYQYIIYDAARPNLTRITENIFNQNVLDLFEDPVTIGGYKIYVKTNASNYNESFTYTLA